MRVAIGRIVGWASVAAALAGCASDPTPRMGIASSSPCLLEQSPLVLADGTELYVEPQNLFRLRGDWMVAGAPTYQWSVAPGRDAISVTRNAHAAAFLGEPAREVESPVRGLIGSMITTPLGDGRWAAIFDEIDPDSLPARHIPLSYWYGEHDGTRWTLVEPLPVPDTTDMALRASSNMVVAGDRLVWIGLDADFVRTRKLLRYDRLDGAWRHQRLPDELVENAVLRYDETAGLLMLLVGTDEELPGFQKSIRLYRDGSPRELIARVTAEPGNGRRIYWPSVVVQESGPAVSWVVASEEGWRAFARTGIRPGAADSIVQLDDNALHLYDLTMPDGSLAWVADHLIDGTLENKELRLLRLDGSRVVRLAAVRNPLTGFFAAQPAGPDEVLLVGPQMGRVQTETPVRSLILRLSTSC
jgi:hypothetical protein